MNRANISIGQLKHDIGYPAFVAARFALILSIVAVLLSAVAIGIAVSQRTPPALTASSLP